MADKLVNRLRGQYEIGEGAMYGKRDFSDFIPAISLEAADRIEQLENAIAMFRDNPISKNKFALIGMVDKA